MQASNNHENAPSPLHSFDADVWATEFMKMLDENGKTELDHDLMRGWFANALMRGYDEKAWRMKKEIEERFKHYERVSPLKMVVAATLALLILLAMWWILK